MANKAPAKCGTVSGHARHVARKEKICAACRAANTNATHTWRSESRGPSTKRFCDCGKETRTEHAKCGQCRRARQVQACTGCGKEARNGNTLCPLCAMAAGPDDELPTGWIRARPGGPLVGVQTPHNHPSTCTAHLFCDNRREEAA